VVREEPNPAAALDAAISELCRAVGASGGAVLRGREAKEMSPVACWGVSADAAGLVAAALGPETITHRAGLCLAGKVAQCRQAVEGAVLLWQPEENGDFAASDRALIADVADYAGLLLAQLAGLERVVTASRTDPLTGLSNRRAFFDQLDRALGRLAHGSTAGPWGALLFIDIDHFKLVNDRCGHAAGDEALKNFAALLASQSRAGDLAARLGGDEFVLWIAGIGQAAAERRAAQLREACRPLASLTGDPDRPLGLSIGIAVASPGEPPDAAQLVAAADAAMYEVKAAHR
jgi:diguanylate cyclase (GGDEF)-like protein